MLNYCHRSQNIGKPRFSENTVKIGFHFFATNEEEFANRTQNSSFSLPTRENNAMFNQIANHVRLDERAVNHHTEINTAVTE